MEEYFVVDSIGVRYNLYDPKFEPKLGIWPVILGLISLKQYAISWKIEEQGSVELSDLKNLIKKDFERNFSVWQALDLDYLKARIDEATTVSELIEAFAI
ncbi:hypothetical protein GCM10008090_35120 [Arenicella chitinivorans]|uniref:Uncharacterized protein n=2 Tax=Arenicella chitinivorans TaxID=1329800 RepID=A0A918VTU9_9GAMM|nr:hypothetical protein GCM10008090_35120 [Arenicella chitinivorans]